MAEKPIMANGENVAVSVGDYVTLRLEEMATSGYQWTLTSIEGPLEVVANEALPGEPGAEPVPGAAVTRLIRLRATSAGSGRIALQMRRPWEPTPARDFSATVTVH